VAPPACPSPRPSGTNSLDPAIFSEVEQVGYLLHFLLRGYGVLVWAKGPVRSYWLPGIVVFGMFPGGAFPAALVASDKMVPRPV
jgi:hypothetical protein